MPETFISAVSRRNVHTLHALKSTASPLGVFASGACGALVMNPPREDPWAFSGTARGACKRCATIVEGRSAATLRAQGIAQDRYRRLSSELASDRRAARSGSSVTRNYRGEIIDVRNTAGRCEDAPCCGCCS